VRWSALALCVGLIVVGAPADGAVSPAVRGYLAVRYTADVERGYCITKWHKDVNAAGVAIPVIDEVVDAPNQRSNSAQSVQFDCGRQPTLHTHPPQYPQPSIADIAKGIVRGGLPFIAIQSGPDVFDFWVVGDRL
jgi:hypothetical protein